MSIILFQDRIMSEKGDIVYQMVATADYNRSAFYCVLVLPSKEEAFKTALASGELNIADYGTVIASCYGEEANDDVKRILKEKYGL